MTRCRVTYYGENPIGRQGVNRMLVDCPGGGSVTADLSEEKCEIVWYGSHPRGKGYGRMALPLVEEALWDHGCERITLDPQDRASEKFWFSVGYTHRTIRGFRVMVKDNPGRASIRLEPMRNPIGFQEWKRKR